MTGLFAVGLLLPRLADQLANRRHSSPFPERTVTSVPDPCPSEDGEGSEVTARGKPRAKHNRAEGPRGFGAQIAEDHLPREMVLPHGPDSAERNCQG
jgi:hypothetical protein